MIYQSGTYSSMHNLLGTIKTFLESNGWTVNKWELDEQGYWSRTGIDYTGAMRLHIQKTASDSTVMYFNFKSVTRGIIFGDNLDATSQSNGRYYSEIRGIGINGSTGYSATEKWDEQPGYPVSQGTSKSVGSCITEVPVGASRNYYIFSHADSCTIVVQIDDNRFVYLAFGLLTKSGVYTGGQFYAGSIETYQPSYIYWYLSANRRIPWRSAFLANGLDGNNYFESTFAVYIDVDGSASWKHNGQEGSGDTSLDADLQIGVQPVYARTDDSVSTNRRYAVNLNEFVYDRSPNHFNGVSILAPVYIFVTRATGRYTYIGMPKGIRIINRSPYDSGDEFSLGSDTWKVFPAFDIADELSTIINMNPHVGFALLKAEA